MEIKKKVVGKNLVISIPLDILECAYHNHPDFDKKFDGKIKDKKKFAEHIINIMETSDEQYDEGTDRLETFLDSLFKEIYSGNTEEDETIFKYPKSRDE